MTVEVTRGVVESTHLVDVVVIGPTGPVFVAGDASRAILPRSAIKPIQVLPLIETGAAEHFDLSDEEIALGAASHSAEPPHTAAVQAWLARMGLNASALECGPARPLTQSRADDLLRSGVEFAPIHNCCSGKHAGFLAVAKHLGHELSGYIARDHPVQELVADAITRYTGVDTADLAYGVDGCGIPTFEIPLQSLATAMRRLAVSQEAAPRRVISALGGRAFWLSGTHRHETLLESIATEPLIAKVGAEGVFVGILPERGFGIALKARDGAERAANAAMTRVLAELGVVDPQAVATNNTNRAGTVVGSTEAHLS